MALSSNGLKGSLLLAVILRSRNTTNRFVAINNSSYEQKFKLSYLKLKNAFKRINLHNL